MTKNLNNAVVGDNRPESLDYVATPTDTDGISSQKETTYHHNEWRNNYGLFLDDPHFANGILNNSDWIWGGGWEADELTEIRMEQWTGWGKDTALDIFSNMETTAGIEGDAHAEIIWNDKEARDFPINLKPLNPGTIAHVVNDKGILEKYQQTARLEGGGLKAIRDFDPRDIFHLTTDRIADQIHGTSKAKRLKKYILAQGESFDDNKSVMHREAKPVILVKLKTDDTTKIANIKDKLQTAMRMSTDNMLIIPDDENILTVEVLKINSPSPILMQWKDSVRKDMYSTIGSPELLSDSSGATESGGKIGNLNFSQVVRKRQLQRELQVMKQLHLKINLVPPKSIEDALVEDANKDGQLQQQNFQPQDAQGGRNDAI